MITHIHIELWSNVANVYKYTFKSVDMSKLWGLFLQVRHTRSAN